MTDVSAEDLQKQLEDYEGQLSIVEAALRDDPSSPEFLEVKANLVDVIKVLLALALTFSLSSLLHCRSAVLYLLSYFLSGNEISDEARDNP